MPKRKKINLALQGGGAHGAFTWGLLDKFLESKLFTIEGISATSAGSMNAAALAYGYLHGEEEGARECLFNFWQAMSDYGKLYGITAKSPIDYFIEPFSKTPFNFYIFSSLISLFSPYQFNPFNLHPIRDVLEKIIDIEQIKNKSKIKLFICATNVQTGKIRIFDNNELSVNTLLASACLPKLFQSIEIDGEYYWDGGYLGNPAIFPLIYKTDCRDIMIFHTVPIVRKEIPTTSAEIDSRLREVSFNSSLMREMRAIAFVSNLISKGQLKKEYEKNYKKLFIHIIRADEDLREFPLSTVYSPDWDFLVTLRDLGRQEASLWIEKNYDHIGKKTTIEFGEWL
ncbi:phospholipase, patatin family [Legionella wadsworthii]|uniref:Phospholipase, patatin family n=1 Tax=Legionella wadsworthii TaxID=28088 RepID=A0A378M0I3_9GAMM|nr:patatin-like phospholipase family protein [Legionella wadsworthii]STY29841.1 phospholipase, patatin family [Legionella wadsworthii]